MPGSEIIRRSISFPAPEEVFPVGTEFASARFALVDVPGLPLPLYVYKDEKEGFSAVSTRCMHRGCQVEPVDGHLVCPCHGSEYTNQGEVMKGPTLLPLQRYAVTADEESVVITISEPAG